ncbi:hypothetical protein [Streptomyces sp. NPDC004783]|uniref:hypothetical protein n=1 Tax=Streptomyces sp. NPDC004783 TaxID=3154459 RepID=UPI0033A4307F
MTVPVFTQTPGGFVTAHQLPDGRFLIEGWHLNLAPHDSDQPRHDIHYEWIANTPAEATETVKEFVGWLTTPIGTPTTAAV